MRRIALLGLFIALPLAGCGTTAPHQGRWNPNGGPPRDENWHSPNAALMRFDANHDGTLTRAEVIAGLRVEFGTYDSDHNNCLSPDEVRAINQLRVQQDASQASPLVDWNQDGCVDFNEFSGATLSLFDSLDTNGDGQLTPAELSPGQKRAPRTTPDGERGGHHGRGGGRGGGGQ